jgi:hypothetical protein
VKQVGQSSDGEKDETGKDEDDEYDEEASREQEGAIMSALMKAFSSAAEGADPLTAQNAVLHFAIAATHMLMYDIVGVAREVDGDAEGAALGWLAENQRMFAEGIANAEQIRQLGIILGEPVLRLRFDRKFRRQLRG